MDNRFKQANKEALWALALTILYVICWLMSAYLPGNQPFLFGLPCWFVLSCLLTPTLFIGLCIVMIKRFFKEISLDPNHHEH